MLFSSGQKKNKGELLLSIEPGWVHFLFTTADCGWEMETPSFLPNEQTETEAMLNSGGMYAVDHYIR